ncbi:MAG: zinc ABC transporter substrate-binding protein [Xanthomonadaceae bacterium]|nr:zinc ABC transporter substrate-binding protein [Xanthomonadaceae bacterium]
MKALWLLLLAGFAWPAQAALTVLACEPEWAALTEELAGDLARVSSATTAHQDPHRIEARPSLIARTRNADLLVCTGAELEIGWLPLLLRESGNARIQPGRPGYFEATNHVELVEQLENIDRSMGDVHAAGNPHIVTDPRNLLPVAAALAARLAQIDPANADDYAARHEDFAARLRSAIARWEQDAKQLRGVPVLVHHANWSYLARWLGLEVVGDLEPKPGIEPSVAQLGRLLETLREHPARMTLRSAYHAPRASEWLAARAGIPAVELPYTVGGSEQATDLFSLYEDTITRLQAALP